MYDELGIKTTSWDKITQKNFGMPLKLINQQLKWGKLKKKGILRRKKNAPEWKPTFVLSIIFSSSGISI